MFTRIFLTLSLILAMPLLSPITDAFADQLVSEGNTDRPGNDYRNFTIPKATGLGSEWSSCRGACQSEAQCKAWTLVNAGAQGPLAKCYLKNVIPGKRPCNFCTSGTATKAVEPNVDRPGGDYKRTENSTKALCRSACDGDAKCQAWTFVNPGVQAASGVCYLKNKEPDAFTNNCCTSGVSQRGPVVN
jgi:hypothetical protein